MARRPKHSRRRYDAKRLHKEREYGFFWYSWLWHSLRPLLIFLCSIIVVAGITSMGWNYVYSHFLMPMEPGSTDTVNFTVEKNATVSGIASDLVEQKILRNKGIFKYMVSFQGLSGSIQYGQYELSPGMTVNQIIEALTTGDGKSKERQITIVPGWTVEDIADYLFERGAIQDKQEFLTLCNDVEQFKNECYALQEAYNNGKLTGRKYALEGYLAPDTYRIYVDASPEDIIKTLLAQTDVVMERAYNNNQTDVVYDEEGNVVEEATAKYETDLNEEEIIILASIIEKEAALTSDYAKVSAVFYNRLAQGMRLESDATVSYPLEITNRMILTEDELNTDSIYNTYKVDGLPGGPICNPSPAAIEAALYPDVSFMNEGYLYFCAKDMTTQELEFSKTSEEHQAAVAKYRPSWEAFDQQQASATPEPTAEPTVEPTPEAGQPTEGQQPTAEPASEG